jgi:lipopolysaccharide export system protein LptA
MTKIIKQFGFLITLQLLTTQASGGAAEAMEKVLINADHMQLNLISGNSVYTGNVKISQGELVLSGDKVTLKQSDGVVEQLTVIGKPARYNNVTEQGEAIEAESEQMVYTASQNKLVMTKNARLTQPDHHVSSQKIIYDTQKKIILAGDKNDTPTDSQSDPEQRVKIILTPKQTPTQDAK